MGYYGPKNAPGTSGLFNSGNNETVYGPMPPGTVGKIHSHGTFNGEGEFAQHAEEIADSDRHLEVIYTLAGGTLYKQFWDPKTKSVVTRPIYNVKGAYANGVRSFPR